MGQTSKKSEISISKSGNSIRLRWRHKGIRFSCNPGLTWDEKGSPELLNVIELIQEDIENDSVDCTYNRYKPKSDGKFLVKKDSILKKFDFWVNNIANGDIENPSYNDPRIFLKNLGNFYLENFLESLNKAKISPRTYNIRLYKLVKFFKYLVKKGQLPFNPLEEVKAKRDNKATPDERLPLTTNEIGELLEAIRTDRFVNPNSHYKHSHYYPFLYFMFNTGCRNAEAIGLRVRDVDFKAGYIYIRSVLARTQKGTNDAARIRKTTKTGKQRYIPINKELGNVLKGCCTGKKPNDLVFTSYSGGCVDDKMLQRRVLKPVLKELGYGHKVLYVARHSYCTITIENGYSIPEIAKIVGNTPETIMRNYLHLTNKPQRLPSINKKKGQ